MKFWLISLIMMLGISLTMCACGHDSDEPIQNEEPTPDPNPETEPTTGNGKVLVAYFSCTNTTKMLAEDVAEITNGTLYRILRLHTHPLT